MDLLIKKLKVIACSCSNLFEANFYDFDSVETFSKIFSPCFDVADTSTFF